MAYGIERAMAKCATCGHWQSVIAAELPTTLSGCCNAELVAVDMDAHAAALPHKRDTDEEKRQLEAQKARQAAEAAAKAKGS